MLVVEYTDYYCISGVQRFLFNFCLISGFDVWI